MLLWYSVMLLCVDLAVGHTIRNPIILGRMSTFGHHANKSLPVSKQCLSHHHATICINSIMPSNYNDSILHLRNRCSLILWSFSLQAQSVIIPFS